MKKVSGLALGLAAAAMLFSGCAKKSASNENFVIGGVFPLSGDVAVYGVECQKGVQLAIDEINAAGGVNGKQIVLVSEDDEGSSEKSINAYTKLTTQDKVDVVIGSLTSGCTKAITALSGRQKILQMAPAATAVNITIQDDGTVNPYVFRACYTDPFQGTVGGVFAAKNLKAVRAAVLFDIGNDYSVGLTENFVKAFTENGGEIVAKESYSTGDKDFNAQLTKIKIANPDVVYLPDYYSTVALIAKQLRAQGINTPIVGADGWDGLVEKAGDEVLNGYYSNHYASDSDSPVVQKYVQAFRAKYGKEPNSFAALGYDSVYMLKDAAEASGAFNGAALRDAMEKLDGNYVTGHLTFDANHNPVKSAVMVKLVRDAEGKLVTVYDATVEL